MILHTMLLTPFGFATGTFEVMAQLGLDNTGVTSGKTLETGITITLVEAFAGFAATGDTVDFTLVTQADAGTE
jgi:hypothetical protein